jgi:phage terminase large subunit-like protein
MVLTRGINMTEADLRSKLIIGLNEIDKWCIGNATLKVDNSGFSILEKIKGNASKKIDGAVTLIMVMEMYARYRSVLDNDNN